MTQVMEQLLEVEIGQIRVNPFQPRRQFADEELEELAASIQSVGIIQPPVVRPNSDGSYELVSGERRYRAAMLAGKETIPVIVREGSSSLFTAQAALIENVQRVDLNPIEIGMALRRLMEEFGFQQDELAMRVGKKRSTVANYLRLLSLPASIQESLSRQEITMGHAKALLSLRDIEKQQVLHDKILREGLSVRETENFAQKMINKPSLRRVESERDCHLESLAEQIQHRLGTKVAIQGAGDKGKITIDYYNLDDLDRVLRLIGLESV